jgi:maltooligosyltrehalose trehalohydrolase
MGQEWAASTPFLFFTDHEPELGRKVTDGRREEFRGFAAFRDPAAREDIPDPQMRETFLHSKLNWTELTEGFHLGSLGLYREFLRLRRESIALRDRSRSDFRVLPPSGGTLRMIFGKHGEAQWLILADLVGGQDPSSFKDDPEWELVLCSNEKRFGGDEGPAFVQPEVRVYRITNRMN